MEKEDQILSSWETNSAEWIKLVNSRAIESRQVTNPAIVKRIQHINPRNLLDLGCGEGWLSRELSAKGIAVTGVDATAALIAQARKKGREAFHVLTYEQIETGSQIPGAPFEAMVFNFSLYQENLSGLLKSLQHSLTNEGVIFIQSIHPYFLIQSELEYKSQWIANSWKGLKGNFSEPHSWFARTLSQWLKEFENSGLHLAEISEPGKKAGVPLSIIFRLQKK